MLLPQGSAAQPSQIPAGTAQNEQPSNTAPVNLSKEASKTNSKSVSGRNGTSMGLKITCGILAVLLVAMSGLFIGWNTKLGTANNEIASLNGQVSTLTSANNQLQTNLNTANTNLTSTQNQLTSVQAQNGTLTSQVATLTTQNQTLSSQNTTLTSQNTSLTSQNSTLTSQNSTLTTQNNSLSSQVTSLNNQITNLNSQLQNEISLPTNFSSLTSLQSWYNANISLFSAVGTASNLSTQKVAITALQDAAFKNGYIINAAVYNDSTGTWLTLTAIVGQTATYELGFGSILGQILYVSG